MALPRRQNPADWVTQAWNIALGRRVDQTRDGWLVGPIGRPGETAESFISRLAKGQRLSVARDAPGSGLLDDVTRFGVAIPEGIAAFYTRTTDFEIAARTHWHPAFAMLGGLVARIFSRRIQQLHLPRGSDSARNISSEIITLADATGEPVYRVWYRRVQDTGEVIFYGIYTSCLIPTGECCLKVIFPLPCGSATVILRVEPGPAGGVRLRSSGTTYGDPGFYFLVEDRNGDLWKHYLPSFREEIAFTQSPDGDLRARHSMSLWHLPVYEMDYAIHEKRRPLPTKAGGPPEPEAP